VRGALATEASRPSLAMMNKVDILPRPSRPLPIPPSSPATSNLFDTRAWSRMVDGEMRRRVYYSDRFWFSKPRFTIFLSGRRLVNFSKLQSNFRFHLVRPLVPGSGKSRRENGHSVAMSPVLLTPFDTDPFRGYSDSFIQP